MGALPRNRSAALLAIAMAAIVGAPGSLADPATGNPPTCTEPFCTYGPPRLTGDAMAAATREIIAAAQKIDYGFLPENWPKEEAFLNAFLQGENFSFLSPYYIAENRDDAHLRGMHGLDCIRSLTTGEYVNGPPDDFTGPFYLYKVKPSLDSSNEYPALFVFGGATKYRHQEMSFDERVERAQSTGYFYILDQDSRCERLFTWSILGRDDRKFVSRYTPRFAGVGYYKGVLLIYGLQPINTPIDPEAYIFSWLFGVEPRARKYAPDQYGSVLFPHFPEDFDPFAVVNRRESLP